MPNVQRILQEEITRIAKRETKVAYDDLYKRIQDLKTITRNQRQRIEQLEGDVTKVSEELPSPDEKIAVSKKKLEESRLSGALIKKLRTRLKLSRDKFAALVGATPHTVYLWENGTSNPREKYKAKIIGLRSIGKRKIKEILKDKGVSLKKKKPGPKKGSRKSTVKK